MDLHACLLDNADDENLVLFLDKLGESSEQVLGYHYPFYRQMLEKIGVGDPLYVGVKNVKGEICAVMPGFIKTQPEGTVYSSLPFFGPNGGLLYERRSDKKNVFYGLAFEFLFKKLETYNMISASFYSPFNAVDDVDPMKKAIPGAITIEKFTSYIPLTLFELSNEFVDSSALRNARKAEKSGVTIRNSIRENEIDIIYSIYLQNCKDYNIPVKPKKTIEFLLTDPSSKNYVQVYIAEHEGKIIGALIMVCSPSTASYYIPCNIHEYRNLQPNAFLIARALDDLKKSGKKFWNWESSPSRESGVYQFKKKWGSVDSEYVIFVKPFKDKSFFATMGQSKITEAFPYFFVYPFNLL